MTIETVYDICVALQCVDCSDKDMRDTFSRERYEYSKTSDCGPSKIGAIQDISAKDAFQGPFPLMHFEPLRIEQQAQQLKLYCPQCELY